MNPVFRKEWEKEGELRYTRKGEAGTGGGEEASGISKE